jgi:hypothetical protein
VSVFFPSFYFSRVPKLPEATRKKEEIFNKGSLFYSHCDEILK